MEFKGLDIGSTTTKLVHIEDNKIKFKKIMPTVKFLYNRENNGFDKYVTTGYGRFTIAHAKIIPEIRAHVLGAIWQTDLKTFTLLDIGGQDFKIIHVKNNTIIDFYMNDKCAAGTGRFLEKMAYVLDTELDKMSEHYAEPLRLNSVCTVFAETELISKMMDGFTREQLMAGVNWTIFEKFKPFLSRYKSEYLIFTGGVAKNQALKKIIEAETEFKVIVPPEPQLNGAIGCAYYSLKLERRETAHLNNLKL